MSVSAEPAEASAPMAHDLPELSRSRAILGEAKVVARAITASTAGTFVDGVLYQVVVFAAAGKYAVAALFGAALGAITNFFLGRAWVFPNAKHRIASQLGLYFVGSALTYLALHASLLVLVEKGGLDARLAWMPGKVVAWALVSYPFQRLVVFRGKKR